MDRWARGVTATEPVELTDGHATVEVRKVTSPNGERLEVRAPDSGATVRLDALNLESLTWQDRESLRAIVAEAEGVTAPADGLAELLAADPAADAESGTPIQVGNEYTIVTVTPTRAGPTDLLSVESQKLAYTVDAPPVVLAALATRSATSLSAFLETPFGPAGH